MALLIRCCSAEKAFVIKVPAILDMIRLGCGMNTRGRARITTDAVGPCEAIGFKFPLF